MRYYLIKVKGLAKIPDYVQIRDENFTLICYIRPDRTEKRTPLPEGLLEALSTLFPQLSYGVVQAVEWNSDTRTLVHI